MLGAVQDTGNFMRPSGLLYLYWLEDHLQILQEVEVYKLVGTGRLPRHCYDAFNINYLLQFLSPFYGLIQALLSII